MTKMSLPKEIMQKTKIGSVKQICNCFFMIPKEVHNLAYCLKSIALNYLEIIGVSDMMQ